MTDRNDLNDKFHSFLQGLTDGTNQDHHIKIREYIEELTKKAYENGGDSLKIVPKLHGLRKAYINDLESSYANNRELLDTLNNAENYYHENMTSKIHNLLCCQIIREDTPISASEIVPSVLSEDIDTLKAFIDVFSDKEEILNQFKKSALIKIGALLAVNNGHAIPSLEEKMILLGR